MKTTFTAFFTALLLLLSLPTQARELAGVTVPDQITVGDNYYLDLNGMGLREKFWIDVYVGSLYLPKPSKNVGEILVQPGPLRIQLDFIYKEVTSDKLVNGWKEGFENNQDESTLNKLQSRIEKFYGFFAESAHKGDRYTIDYIPGQGTSVSKNGVLLGTIEGEDFKTALLEIWLGNKPADKNLKKGMLGL